MASLYDICVYILVYIYRYICIYIYGRRSIWKLFSKESNCMKRRVRAYHGLKQATLWRI
jgi:hypothetical protein